MNRVITLVISTLFSGLIGAALGAYVMWRIDENDRRSRLAISQLEQELKIVEETIVRCDKLEDNFREKRYSVYANLHQSNAGGRHNVESLVERIAGVEIVIFDITYLLAWVNPYLGDEVNDNFGAAFRELSKRGEKLEDQIFQALLDYYLEPREKLNHEKPSREVAVIDDALNNVGDFFHDFKDLLLSYRIKFVKRLKHLRQQ